MKSLKIYQFISLIALFFLLASCKKDDEAGIKNQITFGDKSFEIVKGELDYISQANNSPSTYRFSIELAGSSSGDVMDIDMFSSSQTEIAPGIYQYDNYPNNSKNAFTFGYSVLYINFFEVDGETVYPKSGTIEIKESGTTYEIVIDCAVNTGAKITGYYKGSLNIQ
jgi:hypothetical protein